MDREFDKGGPVRFVQKLRVCHAFDQYLPVMVDGEDHIQMDLLDSIDGLYTLRKSKKAYREEFVMHFFKGPSEMPKNTYVHMNDRAPHTVANWSFNVRFLDIDMMTESDLEELDTLYLHRKPGKMLSEPFMRGALLRLRTS